MTPEQILLDARRLRREIDHLESGHDDAGLGPSHRRALVEIALAGPIPVGELADALLLDKSTVSRLIGQLEESGLVKLSVDRADRRRKRVSLSARGAQRSKRSDEVATAVIVKALESSSSETHGQLARGVAGLAAALERNRRRGAFSIRSITKADNAAVADVIRTVMPEFGAAGAGFAIEDGEVDDMYSAYNNLRSGYWVIERDHRVVGGGGFGPLIGADRDICELRKMYFLREVRSLGLGPELYQIISAAAKAAGFRTMYLETLHTMIAAQRMYRALGFAECSRLGATGHHGCDTFFAKPL